MSAERGATAPDRPLVPVALGTALVLVTYVTPVVSVGPTVADLDAGASARAWILSSMSVGLAGALLATGVLGDTFGRRRGFLAGLAAMAAGSLGCAVSPTALVMIGSRVLEGVGGGAVLACGLSLLAGAYPSGAARLRATSAWGASVGVGIGTGCLLAGVLDVGSGWRETYALTAVLTAALLVASAARLQEARAVVRRRVDVPGLVLLVVGLVLVVSALTEARDGLEPPAVALAAGGLLALAGFAVVERRVAAPLVEPALLRHRGFLAATTGSLVLGLGMIGMASFVPTVAAGGLDLGPLAGGALVAVWAGVSVAASLALRHLPFPVDGPRAVAVVLVVVAAGQLVSVGIDRDDGTWRVALSMAVAGLGTGVLNAVLGRDAVASVPADRAAMGSGANNTARYLGAAIGITLFVTLATHTGGSLLAGWSHAVLVAAALTLLGAAFLAVLPAERAPAGPA